MIMIFNMPVTPWSSSAMLARQPEVGQHSPEDKGTKKGAHLRGRWLRFAWLATVLALAIPATAAPLHRIVAVGDLHGDFSAWRDILLSARVVDNNAHWTGGNIVLLKTRHAVNHGP